MSASLADLTSLAAAAAHALPGGLVGDLLRVHGPAAYAVVAALAFAEAGLLVGFFVPGETAVVVGGVLAGLHQVDLGVMMAVVVAAAIVGDSVGYLLGREAGPWLVDHRPLRGRSGVRRTLGLLERYGGAAVFLGRFVAFARAVIPGLAGMSGVRYRVFLAYNVAGGLLWGVGYTLLGYLVGVSFEHLLSQVGIWSVAAVGTVVGAAVVAKVVHDRRRRAAVEDVPEVELAATVEVVDVDVDLDLDGRGTGSSGERPGAVAHRDGGG